MTDSNLFFKREIQRIIQDISRREEHARHHGNFETVSELSTVRIKLEFLLDKSGENSEDDQKSKRGSLSSLASWNNDDF